MCVPHVSVCVLLTVWAAAAVVAGLVCTFEDGERCAWDWRPRDDSVKVVTGSEAVDIVMTRPPGDMTAAVIDADDDADGHYLLMFDWGEEVKAQLISPWFKESGDSCRLQMEVHYYSADRSRIAVIVNKTSSPNNPIFVTGKYHGRKINTWDTFTEKIGRIGEPFQLTVEVHVLPGRPRNHIGIDNIQLLDCGHGTAAPEDPCTTNHLRCENGACVGWDRVCDITKDCQQGEDELQQCDELPRGARCDFETDLCGWRPDRGQLKWRRHTGPAVAEYTGPADDHTLGTEAGHYMFLDIKGGDFAYYAVLKSPWFPPMPAYNRDASSPYFQSCVLRFYVHLYGSHIGEASVYIVDAENGRKDIWRHFGSKSNSWERVALILPVKYNSSYYLEFQGARSFGNKGNMGLDDISLTPECFAKRVPVELSRPYKYDLKNATTWEIAPTVAVEPNGTVYTFGACGTSGPGGPQQRACDLAYQDGNVRVQVLDHPRFKGFQTWTVPSTGLYAIVAAGASGGRGFDSKSGSSRASEVVSVVELYQGEEMYMVVGQEGTNACNENASEFYRESCQSRYSAVPEVGEAAPLEYHAAMRQILHSVRGRPADRGRQTVDWSRLNGQPPGGRDANYGRVPSPTERLRTDGRWRFPSLNDLQRPHDRGRRDVNEAIHSLQKMQFVGGGGGGGGGTFVFKVVNQRQVPVVVAGGGGGLSDNDSEYVSPHGRGENRTAGNLNGRTTDSARAGPGGGWNGTLVAPSGGGSLLSGAIGGAPCPNGSSWHTHGGFGGGGGGCSAGGGGGGFAGGDAFQGADKNGLGGLSFTSGLYRVVREASHVGPGHVHIIPSFVGCGCQYLCIAVDRKLSSRRCICQDGWYLMSDKVTCQGPPEGTGLKQWSDVALVVVAALAAVFLLVIATLVACYYSTYQRKKTLIRRREQAGMQLNRLRNSAGDILTEYNPNYEFGGTLPCSVKELKEIPRESLTLIKQLGQGAFGLVYQGYLRSSASDSVEMTVAVKTLAELSAPHAELDFIMEAAIMSRFDHPNIVHFIGVSFDRHPRYIVLELLAGGDLKSFLREVRPTRERPSSLKMFDLLTCVIDVAKGLQYLETKRFIHRDIAARNCLLTTKGPGRVVKIADFGMSKDIYRADYYRKGGRTMIPVKWMPPEAFLDGMFTSKTDVWSFGVLMWEVMTLGMLPYPGRGNTEVMQIVMDGGRLECPARCPGPVYAIMGQCWQQSSDDRPSFSTVLERLNYCIQDPDVLSCTLPVLDNASCGDRDVLTMRPTDTRPLSVCTTPAPGAPAQTAAARRDSCTDYLLPTDPSGLSVNTLHTELTSELSAEDLCRAADRAGGDVEERVALLAPATLPSPPPSPPLPPPPPLPPAGARCRPQDSSKQLGDDTRSCSALGRPADATLPTVPASPTGQHVDTLGHSEIHC